MTQFQTEISNNKASKVPFYSGSQKLIQRIYISSLEILFSHKNQTPSASQAC
jgi:hypothetical protein